MAEGKKVPNDSLRAPTLSAPVEGKVIEEPGAITFRWEEIEEAGSYQLQIAEDESFSEMLLNVEVGEVTARTVKGIFQERDKQYVWRVRAKAEDGTWGPFSGVARFVVASEELLEMRAERAERPEEQEERGPAAELLKAAGLEAAAQVTGREELEEAAREMGVEEEGIPAKQILMITAITIFIVAGFVVALFIIVNLSTAEITSRYTEAVEYPELRETQSEATRRLTQYEIVDSEEEVYRIPIDRAIELVIREYERPEDLPTIPEADEE